MRDPKRIDKLLKEVSRVWKQHPDLRLFQFTKMLEHRFGCPCNDCFGLEDDKILELLGGMK